MQTSTFFPYRLACCLLCSLGPGSVHAGWFSSTLGVALRYDLEPGSAERFQMQAHDQSGRRLFGVSRLDQGNPGTLSTGAPLPATVRFTWYTQRMPGREPLNPADLVTHEIPVASRIPTAVLDYATETPGRALFLSFRLHDQGVKLAWNVQEAVRHPSGGIGWVYSLHGGDMSCEEWGVRPARCTKTPLKDAPWYIPAWVPHRF